MLPKQAKYGNKVMSAQAQSYRTNIQPQNGTGPYATGQTIILNIPTANNLVLVPTESYLKFALTLTNGGTAGNAVWDACGSHGLIQRIRVYHGSNLLQDIDQYGQLAKMLFDLQVPTDACYGRYNELVGTRNDTTNTSQIATADSTDGGTASTLANAIKASLNAGLSSNQVNSGEYYTLGANASTTRYFCLNLISLVGSLCSQQYIPLFAMTSAPLRVEIQLVSNIYQAIASTSALTSIALNNVEYIANFIRLSDGAIGAIYDSLQGQPLEFSVPDYSNYQYTYSTINANTSAQVNFAIPAKYSSLKSLFCTIRDQGTGTATYFPFSTITGGITSYYFRVGSNIIPTKAPDNLPEMFSELLKAMGSMSDLSYQPSIERNTYESSASTAITTANYKITSSGSFYIGQDLESFVNADKSTMFAGYNSNNDDIFAVINLTPSANLTPRFDAFALFDATLTFINGTAVRSF